MARRMDNFKVMGVIMITRLLGTATLWVGKNTFPKNKKIGNIAKEWPTNSCPPKNED
jgi:hypothetical protein